jgi:hypothetical protein
MKIQIPPPPGSVAGSGLILAILILAALSILGTSIAVVAINDRNLSRYERTSTEALAAAETGIAYAKRAIKDQLAPMQDADGDGRPDFMMADTLSWGGSYEVMAEASDIKGMGITAYQSNGFTIVSEGRFHGAVRRVKQEIVHDSFLKYARFTANNDLSYACDANITGEVFVNGDLLVACGCGSGRGDRFLEMVSVTGDVPDAGCASFYRGYVTDAEPIDLDNSFNWTDVRNKARGLAADNSCERNGNIGIYLNLPGTDPLHLGMQTGSDANVLVLDRLDFQDVTHAPPDTIIRYNGQSVINPLTGQPLHAHDFNGIIMFEAAGKIRGTMDGVSAHNLTVYAKTAIYCMNNIITGHTGFDPVTRLPNSTGDPVNLGLVAEGTIHMDAACPRVMRVDAMLLSRTGNWSGDGTTSSHPAGTGPLDLDLDGIIGETPVNNDPMPGEGWNEVTITSDTWVLNISGGIVTQGTGSAFPWNDTNIVNHASGPTRRYNYDMDLTAYPPPCFPVPLNLFKDVSWTEIFDVRPPLASYLPD